MDDLIIFIRNCTAREVRGAELEADLKARFQCRVVRLISKSKSLRIQELFSALQSIAGAEATHLFFIEDDMTYTESVVEHLREASKLGYPLVQFSIPEQRYLHTPLDEKTYLLRLDEFHYSGAYLIEMGFLREFLAAQIFGSDVVDGQHFDLLITRHLKRAGWPLILRPSVAATQLGLASALGNTYKAQDPLFDHNLSVI